MRLVVFGSTGATGALLLRESTRRRIAVTAFARDPTKLTDPEGLVGVVRGDARNSDAVRDAVDGQDAVIITVSGRGEPGVAREIARTVTEAMVVAGVRRLVLTSAYGMIATKPLVVASAVRRAFARQFADQAEADEIVSATELDWTIARATRLRTPRGTARPARISTGLFDSGPFSLDRAIWAAVLLDLAADEAWPRQFINVTGS